MLKMPEEIIYYLDLKKINLEEIASVIRLTNSVLDVKDLDIKKLSNSMQASLIITLKYLYRLIGMGFRDKNYKKKFEKEYKKDLEETIRTACLIEKNSRAIPISFKTPDNLIIKRKRKFK